MSNLARDEDWCRILSRPDIPNERTATAEQELLAAERHAALREAFTRLPPLLPAADRPAGGGPTRAARQISVKLSIPVGSIGPKRGRCLDRLRHDPAIPALPEADAASATGEPSQQAAVQR